MLRDWKNVDGVEKKVLLAASLVAAAHLLLIAYAAAFLNISVPTCQPNEKLFDRGGLRAAGGNRYEVHYLAKMWAFEPRRLVVPVGATVDFFLGSKDVTHGFHVGGTNVNLMALPGVINKATHTFAKPGTYRIVCHEYCGLGHQEMSGEIEVSEAATVASIADAPAPEESALSAAARAGRDAFTAKACAGCHSIDGAKGVGPTFKGLWGRTEELADGRTVTVDGAYVAESIKLPQAKVVKGYDTPMPALPVDDAEVENLIAYIKTLR